MLYWCLGINKVGRNFESEVIIMRSYRKDPYWTTARFVSKCRTCGRAIRKGERIYYYPAGRVVLCDNDNCGGQGERDFQAAAFDESMYCGG